MIGKSFEFALGHVGQDRQAGDMWMEYIAFLKEGQVRFFFAGFREEGADEGRAESRNVGGSAAHGRAPQGVPTRRSDPAQQRRADLARVQPVREQHEQDDRALSLLPLRRLPLTTLFHQAKKFVSELSPSYMTARKVLRELRALYDAVSAPTLALPRRPDWSLDDDRATLEMWRKYVAYEEGNPLDIEEPMALQMRIAFAYKKAVASLRFFSEIWCVCGRSVTCLGRS